MLNVQFLESITLSQTALFCPSNMPSRVRKAMSSDAGIVIADLEDAVPVADREQARLRVVEVLEDPESFHMRPGMIVRINEPSTPAGVADLDALSGLSEQARRRMGVMVAKTQGADDIMAVSERLGMDVPLIALVESARGVLQAREIAAHPSVVRLALGAIDLAADTGSDVDSETIQYGRAQLVMASAAAGIAGPLDSPCTNFRDPATVQNAARSARRNGLSGILCIHPDQLRPATEAYAPSSEEIGWARKVVAAADGASAMDGQMIDRPVVLKAQAVLAAAGAVQSACR